jgi:hypothetical protein
MDRMTAMAKKKETIEPQDGALVKAAKAVGEANAGLLFARQARFLGCSRDISGESPQISGEMRIVGV